MAPRDQVPRLHRAVVNPPLSFGSAIAVMFARISRALEKADSQAETKTGAEVMSETTIERLLKEISQLAPDQQRELRKTLDQQEQATRSTLDKRVPPRPAPDSQREMTWLRTHAREYANQWVALDGERLIAHGVDAREVYEAAEADGAPLPMVTFVEDPDTVSILF